MPPSRSEKRDRITTKALRQHGVVTRRQAIEAGYSDSAIGRLLGTGQWRRLARGVYLVLAGPDPWRSRTIALVLRAPGKTWASHRTAARLWGFEGANDAVVEVSTTSDLRASYGAVHYVQEMAPADCRVCDGIALTSIERTLVDLGAVVTNDVLEAAAVDALRRGLTTIARLRERAEALAARGRKGPRQLHRLVELWGHASPPESVLESRLRNLLRRHRLPAATPQMQVRAGSFVARLDLAYPDQMIGIEVDGYRWHGDPSAWRADLLRRNELTALGWHVLHFTWRDIEREPSRVARDIRAALGAPEHHESSVVPPEYREIGRKSERAI